jgi:hypothetical protein
MPRSDVDVRVLIDDLDEDIARLERDLASSDRTTPSEMVNERTSAARMAARRSRLSVMRAERATLVALLPVEER